MCEQKQDIEEPKSLDSVKSEDEMIVANLTESLNSIEKGLQILQKIDLQQRVHVCYKT